MPSTFRLSIVNKATVPLNADLGDVAKALQIFLSEIAGPRWDFSATVTVGDPGLLSGEWPITLWDTPDAAGIGSLGYHTDSWTGPSGKVFVKTCQDDQEDWRTVLMHEGLEVCCDPSCSATVLNHATGDAYSLEPADPVEDDEPFHINGIPCPNFVTKAWFGLSPSASYDFLQHLTVPFQLLDTGYAAIIRAGQPIDIYGSQIQADKFAGRDRRGRRASTWKTNVARMLGK